MCKNVSGRYSHKLLDPVRQSATEALKTASKIAIQKTAEATGVLSGNKIANKITKVSRSSPQNTLETVELQTENIGFVWEKPEERYISPEKRQQIIDKLGLI